MGLQHISDTTNTGDARVLEEKRTAVILFIVATLFVGGLLGLGVMHLQMTEAQKAYMHQRAPGPDRT